MSLLPGARRLLWISLAVCLCCLLAQPVTAAEPPAMDPGFTVQAEMPENHLNTGAAYFDLLMEPGQEQVLHLTVTNPGPDEIVVTADTFTASTNLNGLIDYSDTGLHDNSLPHRFSDLATVEEDTYTIAPLSEQEIAVVIAMPEEPFEGSLLGAIRILKPYIPNEDEDGTQMGIVNQFSYVVSVRLTEDLESPLPLLELGELENTLINYKAAVVAPIHNTQATIIKGASVKAQLFFEDESAPVYEIALPEVDIAPNSVFPLSLIDENGYGFPAGSYTAKVELDWEGEAWSFENALTILPETAKEINTTSVNQAQHAVNTSQMPFWAWFLIGSACFIVLLGLIIFFVARRARKPVPHQ